ncbi:MAG: CHASE2 domain-containing protein, partial [Myxococcales bacterium]|nr:CHASE2 domain-containing protein [Myxococcales bacterium]
EEAQDVVVVAIDEASLSQLGRWPWSRRTHAALVDRLMQEGARVIALDILFAEPDRGDPGADAALAASLRRSARVVLPVVLEQRRAGGQLLEQMPLPVLTAAAAALGHVHVELDADGLARSTHLLEGLGEARWPALALAMLRVADPDARHDLPGERAPPAGGTAARVWARDHRVLIPYIGQPGSVPRISYVQALNGQFPEGAFRDRFVLVGVTAAGLGDSLPTPLSGHGHPMPGVEVNAHLLHGLRAGNVIQRLSPRWRIVLSALLAALPVFLYARLGPRYGLLAAVALLAAVLALSAALLALGRVWFGPAPISVVIMASYPVWSWLRLETAMRYLRQELRRARASEADTPLASRPPPDAAMDFLSLILPLDGWVIADAAGHRIEVHGNAPAGPAPRMEPGEWVRRDDAVWAHVPVAGRQWSVGARWRGARPPGEAERRLLTSIVAGFARAGPEVPSDAVEVVQAQILRLQEIQSRMRDLHGVIGDSLAQMGDAAVVANNLGQILVANQRAAEYLMGTPRANLVGEPITRLVAPLKLDEGRRWDDLLRRVLVFGESHSVNARHGDGRDLLVQLAPLAGSAGGVVGLIMNASDISELKSAQRRRAEMLSFLSHDLRSPLVSVLAVLELARAGRASEDALGRIEAYTRTTIDLAEQFVELVRAESQESLRLDEVDLVAVTTNAMEQVWAQGQAKGVSIESGFSVDEAWIEGEGSLLERALVNLLSNAIRHNPAGTTVRVQLNASHGAVTLAVSDDGNGISEADQRDLFLRFKPLAGGVGKRQAGSGLGLAFVKVVVDRHAGRIAVDSRTGEGTTFTLSFPT